MLRNSGLNICGFTIQELIFGRKKFQSWVKQTFAGNVYNPTAPATEEAVKNFFVDCYESWCKCVMNPFFHVGNGDVIRSPVFRARVAAAAKKYL